jgi:selenocysteine lyase/cysteine desulfurase
LCEIAHQRGIYVHVDGAQTWGALNLNVRRMGCDSYAASAHKWFMGPKEVGLLYVNKDRIGEIWPNEVAPGWGNDVDPDVVGARKFESLGQRDDASLAAISTAADFHAAIGAQRIESRVLQLAATLKEQASAMGLRIITPMDPKLSAGVCILDVPQDKQAEVFNTLYEQYGIAGAPTGGLRLCPHLYNTRQHVQRALDGIKKLRPLFS